MSWIETGDTEWELIAHRAWEAIGHLRNFDWPIPCHTLRARAPYINFPEAAAEVVKPPPDDDSGPMPVFPFADFAKLMRG